MSYENVNINKHIMKKNFKIQILILPVALTLFFGCKKDAETVTAPPYAATTQTWEFGNRTWSDAIHIPACNKADFDGGVNEAPKADGRSLTTDEGKTYYYYSWPYVIENAKTLCPDPWRVPTIADIAAAVAVAPALDVAWGLSGFVDEGGHPHYVGEYGSLWSSTPVENTTDKAHGILWSDLLPVPDQYNITNGDAVRCVR